MIYNLCTAKELLEYIDSFDYKLGLKIKTEDATDDHIKRIIIETDCTDTFKEKVVAEYGEDFYDEKVDLRNEEIQDYLCKYAIDDDGASWVEHCDIFYSCYDCDVLTYYWYKEVGVY